MKTYNNTKTLYCDVDSTLIEHDMDAKEGLEGVIMLSLDPTGRHQLPVYEIKTATNMIKKFKALGYDVYVWSQSGGSWAELAVKALGIEDSVDLCLTKPSWYLDDLPVERWMGPRIDPYETKRK